MAVINGDLKRWRIPHYGTKNTDVHLYVYDEDGKEIGKDDSPGPKCSVKVTPAKDGKYKFVIKNAGGDNTVTIEVKVAK